jgi:hypothetical protein
MWSMPKLFAGQLCGTCLYNNSEAVFSVLRGPCYDFIRDTVGRNSQLSVVVGRR